jgi:hypothetical protein
MSTAPLELDYELTNDELRESFNRLESRIRPSWFRRLAACLVLWLVIDGWERHEWWFTVILLVLTLHLWTFPRWLYSFARLIMTLAPRWPSSRVIHIETDDRGLHVRIPPHKVSQRYWWSRLSGVEQTEFGIELYFDKQKWSQLEIPWKAFTSDDQRREFIELVNMHLPHASSPT